ncbi:MAG: class I SAM-dependent methyltransferase [Anaerolineales bacterium]|nr:class I SAM-dependent methyltransferase [Anaerolineales bacterium]MCB8936876.1 class I SAM-dependent methyltransferase [Ardenticatenaceae bacterium]
MNLERELAHLPEPSEKRLALRVSPAAERAVRNGHPWVFDKAIRQPVVDGRSGDLAVIFDRKNRFLAVGLYAPASPIRVRILAQGQPTQIDADWFLYQLETAAEQRLPLLQTNSTGYRLVHGENDGLPGLVIDRYGETLVVKLYTTAWVPHLRHVLQAATKVAPAKRVVLRLSRFVQSQPEVLYGLHDGQVWGQPVRNEGVRFLENGLYFEADVVQGQKTGFFLDQRDNRARVEKLAAGRRVLNVFAYTGGFSLYAARGGAKEVVSLDLSQPALANAMRNFKLNRANEAVAAAEHELLVGDAFLTMQQLIANKRRFEMVIIDPPAFAKRKEEVERAVAAYGRLVRLGLKLLRPGGVLVMASCSSRVSADQFFELVHKTALGVERALQEIERTGHALDHPIAFPEGAYLKCLFAFAP